MLPPVSKTAILTLRARAEEHDRADRVFADPLAAEWWTRIDWPPELDGWYGPDAQYALAFRADDIDHIVRRYSTQRSLVITELGCGLSTRRSRLADLSLAGWFDLDLPEVAALRTSWDAGDDQIGLSVLDYRWMDRLRGAPDAHLFIAEGLLYYLARHEVDALLFEMRRRFAGSAILLDVVGANDYAKLLHNTRSVGAPIQWMFESDFGDVLSHFDLLPIPEFEPERLMTDALKRYWPRFDQKTRGLIYFAMNNELARKGRSGMVLGRLPPLTRSPLG